MQKEELLENGIVVSVNNGKAEIMVIESGACEECSAKVFCAPSSGNSKRLLVDDPIGVKVGDKVRVGLEATNLFKASVILYGIPLVIVIVVLLLGLSLFENINNKEIYSVLLSFGVCGIYYFGVFIFTKKFENDIKLPKIMYVEQQNIE